MSSLPPINYYNQRRSKDLMKSEEKKKTNIVFCLLCSEKSEAHVRKLNKKHRLSHNHRTLLTYMSTNNSRKSPGSSIAPAPFFASRAKKILKPQNRPSPCVIHAARDEKSRGLHEHYTHVRKKERARITIRLCAWCARRRARTLRKI